MVRSLAYGAAYALAIVVGRLVVLPETSLALFWPAAGVGALWALATTRRHELLGIAAAIWVLATVGLAVSGIPALAACVLGVANIVNSVGTALAYRWLTGRSSAEPVPWSGDGVAPLRRLGDVGRFFLATTVATVASAAVGMTALALADIPVTGQTLLGWLLRNSAAIVIIAGAGLAVRGEGELVRRRHLVEAVPVLVVSLAGALAGVRAPGHRLAVLPAARRARLGRAAAADPAGRAAGHHHRARHAGAGHRHRRQPRSPTSPTSPVRCSRSRRS